MSNSKSLVKNDSDLKNISMQDQEEIIPEKYNETKIVLLVKDPKWLFAFWEIKDNDIIKFKNMRLTLRVYNAAENTYFDIGVTDDASNWYINVPESGKNWFVEIGVLDDNNNFILIARSNTVATPPDKISDVVDEEWMIIEKDFYKLYKHILDTDSGGSSESVIAKFLNQIDKERININSSNISQQEHK